MFRIDCGHIIELLMISLIALFVGCKGSNQDSQDVSSSIPEISKEKNPLNFLYQADTLTLSAYFSECGEFGGHKERIDIFRNSSKREYFMNYVVDSIDVACPEGFEENAIVVTDEIIKLNLENEYAIMKYLDSLFARVLISKSPSHSNDYFSAYTRYSGLRLTTAEPDKNWVEFKILVNQLIK